MLVVLTHCDDDVASHDDDDDDNDGGIHPWHYGNVA